MTSQSNIEHCKECRKKKEDLSKKHTQLQQTKPNSKIRKQLEAEIKQLTDTYRTDC